MTRSEINRAIKKMESLLNRYCFFLPDFCHWKPQQWKEKGKEYQEIYENGLGWDVTDYGLNDFHRVGLTLITLRNGNAKNKQYRKPYAEKIMMVEEGQLSPMHFHWNKMEDIINRGGGELAFRLYNADEEEQLSDTDVTVYQDGRCFTVPAGSKVILTPGQSLTLPPRCYHEFFVEKGQCDCLVGEVSTCNDDEADNRFLQKIGRFPTIEEDEPAYRLLCTEYASLLG